MLAALLVNINSGRDATPAMPADFFPSLKPPVKPATTADHIAAAEAWAALGYGTFTRID